MGITGLAGGYNPNGTLDILTQSKFLIMLLIMPLIMPLWTMA